MSLILSLASILDNLPTHLSGQKKFKQNAVFPVSDVYNGSPHAGQVVGNCSGGFGFLS